MTFEVFGSNHVRMVSDGRTAFNSQALSPVITDVVSGQFTINALSPNSTLSVPLVSRQDILLKSGLNPLATDFDGTMLCDRPTPYLGHGVLDGAVHNMGGTTIIWAERLRMIADGNQPLYRTDISGIFDLGSMIDVTPYLSGTTLRCKINRFMPASPDLSVNPYARGNITVTYHGYCIYWN